MSSLDLILRPVITEKATASEKNGKYQFFVRSNATKIAIRGAFQKIYGIAAAKVNVIRTPKKTRSGRSKVAIMKKKELKKVIVTTKGKKIVDITKPKFKS